MEIFPPKKRNSEILVREKFVRPPKLGARSPPLTPNTIHHKHLTVCLLESLILTSAYRF